MNTLVTLREMAVTAFHRAEQERQERERAEADRLARERRALMQQALACVLGNYCYSVPLAAIAEDGEHVKFGGVILSFRGYYESTSLWAEVSCSCGADSHTAQSGRINSAAELGALFLKAGEPPLCSACRDRYCLRCRAVPEGAPEGHRVAPVAGAR